MSESAGARGVIPGALGSVLAALAPKFENVVWTPEISFLTAPAVYTLTLPPGVGKFFVNEVGVVCTSMTGTVATQPTASWGIVANTGKYKAADTMTLLTAADLRSIFNVLLVDEGETTLAVEITVAGALVGAGAYKGKFYFKGLVRS